jgi:hypothetical protein
MSNLNHIKPIVVTGKAGFNRLVQAGFIAAIVATAANLLIYYLIPALFNFTLAIPLQGPGSEIERMTADCDAILHLATAIPTRTRPSLADWAMNDRIRRAGTQVLTEAALY